MQRITLVLMIAGMAAPLAATAQGKPDARPPRRPGTVRPMVPDRPMLPHLPMVPDLPMMADLPMVPDLPMMPDLADVDVGRLADELDRVDFQRMDVEANALRAEMALDRLTVNADLFVDHDSFLRATPRDPWAKDDPADSLYRVARETLNRGEYRRAAQLFGEITQKYPTSQYAQDCRYWEAFSRYRLGGTDDLRQALRILDAIDLDKMMRVGRETTVDIPTLKARVQGALAARGDKDAEERLKREAAQNDGCDREEVSVRAEALAALGQMDMQAALPVVRKVLARRDACTVELRRRALYMVGRQEDSSASAIILDVAKNDPDAGMRSEAMRWLPRVAGEAAVPQLEEILRTSADEQTQRSAVYALSVIDTDRGRRAIRSLIERPDVSERIRYEAILSLSRERDGRSVSAEDIAYLRSLYSKLETPRLREALLTSLSRIETPENQQFLLAVARNENEQPSLRAAAMQRIARMQTVSVSDIAKLYDVADARSLREQILYALAQRKEPEAIDKLIDIARKDTDPQIRRSAISLLARSNNERAKKLLQEMIDR